LAAHMVSPRSFPYSHAVVEQVQHLERKLVAILAADVVGYSRLMGLDETGTLTRLKALRREYIEPLIDGYHGRVVKLMGDGALVEFASVVDAVACAVEIQRVAARQNLNAPVDAWIVFRIGINLGDVIIDKDDFYGDGVNIAARLEGLSDPGGIVISGTAYDQVRNKLGLTFKSLGELPARRRVRAPWSQSRASARRGAISQGPRPWQTALRLASEPHR